jgi:ethanolamine ammonia-lyase small subunit
MYLPDLGRHLSDEMVRAIEKTSTFKVFLVRF